jgi:hypothetical protein
MRRIAAVGMMLILAGIQAGCFESVTEAPLELSLSNIAPPEGLNARVGNATVTIGWRPVGGARRYRVYRSADATDRIVRVAETSDTSYVDTDVQNGRLYFYAVSSVSSDGLEGARSVEIGASPALYAVVINGGEAVTGSREVTLTLTAPETTAYMRISSDEAGSSGAYENYDLGAGRREREES